MRCGTIEKWISDDVDGVLSGRKKKKLDFHLSRCAACRAYRRRLERLQREAGRLAAPSVPENYWETSVARLKAKLGSGDVPSGPRPSPWLRWAWSGSAAVLVLALALYFAVLRTRPSFEPYPLSFENTLTGVFAEVGDNTDFEKDLDGVIRASIREQSGPTDDDVKRYLYGNSLYLDSLSDEEVALLDERVARELKI